jgi:hypothetical protein
MARWATTINENHSYGRSMLRPYHGGYFRKRHLD